MYHLKKPLSILLSLVLLLGVFTMTPITANADGQTPVMYLENGNERYITEYNLYTDGMILPQGLQPGWYVIQGTVYTVAETTRYIDDVHFIICDDSELVLRGKIEGVLDNQIDYLVDIYAQSPYTDSSCGRISGDPEAYLSIQAHLLKVYGGIFTDVALIGNKDLYVYDIKQTATHDSTALYGYNLLSIAGDAEINVLDTGGSIISDGALYIANGRVNCMGTVTYRNTLTFNYGNRTTPRFYAKNYEPQYGASNAAFLSEAYAVNSDGATRYSVNETALATSLSGKTIIPKYASTSTDPYIIYNTEDWGNYAALIAIGSSDHINGYYMIADDFNNDDDPVTTPFGTSTYNFHGNFNGNGKTLNVQITNINAQGAAPFFHVYGASIHDLTVTGSVTSSQYHASGLVGFNGGSTTIENVTVKTKVEGTYIGGVLGHNLDAEITMNNVVFAGELIHSNYYAGGLVGWSNLSTITLNNCFVNCTYTNNGSGKFNPVGCRTDSLNNVHFEQSDFTTSFTNVYCNDNQQETFTDVNRTFANKDVDYWYVSDASLGAPVRVAKGNEPDVNNIYYLYGYVPYVDAKGEQQTPKAEGTECTRITADMDSLTQNTTNGWYYVGGEITNENRVEVTGDVNIILCDGAVYTVDKGIGVSSGNSVTFWQQENGTGKLVAAGPKAAHAAIGATPDNFVDGESPQYDPVDSGEITINGGTFDLKGGKNAAAIGGMDHGDFAYIEINAGNITAKGGAYSAAIGGGRNYETEQTGNILITGGTLDVSGSDAPAIGSGWGEWGDPDYNSYSGDIHITGGYIEITSESGIGGSSFTDCAGDIIIDGGTVISNGKKDCPGIGVGERGRMNGSIIINGGTVTATGKEGGAGIGGGLQTEMNGDIIITGGTVTAAGGLYGAGIGSGYTGSDNTDANCNITISGGKVTATGGSNGAGIGGGGGWVTRIKEIEISGGDITATGYSGIGRGEKLDAYFHSLNALTVGTMEISLDWTDETKGDMRVEAVATANDDYQNSYSDDVLFKNTFVDLKKGTVFTKSENKTDLTRLDDRILVPSFGMDVEGFTISLDGDIGVNYYVQLDQFVVQYPMFCKMKFTLPNTYKPPEEGSSDHTHDEAPVQRVAVEDVINDPQTLAGKEYYVFKCTVAAKEMCDTITAQLQYDFGSDDLGLNDILGFDLEVASYQLGDTVTYSVAQYGDYLLRHHEEMDQAANTNVYSDSVELVKAILYYGGTAQRLFKHNNKSYNEDVYYQEGESGYDANEPNKRKPVKQMKNAANVLNAFQKDNGQSNYDPFVFPDPESLVEGITTVPEIVTSLPYTQFPWIYALAGQSLLLESKTTYRLYFCYALEVAQDLLAIDPGDFFPKLQCLDADGNMLKEYKAQIFGDYKDTDRKNGYVYYDIDDYSAEEIFNTRTFCFEGNEDAVFSLNIGLYATEVYGNWVLVDQSDEQANEEAEALHDVINALYNLQYEATGTDPLSEYLLPENGGND